MAISIVNSTSATAINGGNATIALGTTQSDDCVIVAVTLGTSKTAFALAVTSSSGGAFTQIVSTIQSSNARFGVFRQVVSSASLITQALITGTGGSTDATTGVAHIFRGVSSGTPEDATSTSTTGNSSQPNSPSITPGSNANQGFLPYVAVTSVGLQLVSVTLTAPSSPSAFLDSVIRSANDTWDATTGQAWLTVRSTAAFDPGPWASSVSATAWCAATILLRPDVQTWIGDNEVGTASQVDEQRKIVMTGYGVV